MKKKLKKVPQNAFFDLLFQNFACGVQNLDKTGCSGCSGRARKINLNDLKKVETFGKSAPIEKIPDPP